MSERLIIEYSNPLSGIVGLLEGREEVYPGDSADVGPEGIEVYNGQIYPRPRIQGTVFHVIYGEEPPTAQITNMKDGETHHLSLTEERCFGQTFKGVWYGFAMAENLQEEETVLELLHSRMDNN